MESFEAMIEQSKRKAKGFEDNLEPITKKIVNKNKKAVKDYKAGKIESLNFLVGKLMDKTEKLIEPKQCIEAIKKQVKKLKESD